MSFYKRSLMLASVSSVAMSAAMLMISSGAHAAAATTFDGSQFKVEYGFSFGAPSAAAWAPTFATPTGSASTVEVPSLFNWSINTVGNTVSFTWDKSDDFMNFGTPPFEGFRISDSANMLADIQSITVTNTTYVPNTYGNLVEGFNPAQITFDADNIYINLNTAMWHEHPMASMGDPFRDRIDFTVSFAGAPVPEPETYAMLLAGLGLMGTIARRRSRKG